jgi:hypothetical protein
MLLLSSPASPQEPSPVPSRTSPPRVETLAGQSELVLVGKVLRNSSRWVGKTIVTTSEVQPLETYKGAPPAGTVKVWFLGGTVGAINQDVTHEATLTAGETAVLFLGTAKGARVEGLRMVDQDAKIPVLAPDQPDTRLANDRRLRRFLADIKARVEKGGFR